MQSASISLKPTDSYQIAILVVLGLSSFSLSADIHSRWFAGKRVSLLQIYGIVLGLTSLWGFLIFDPSQMAGNSPLIWALSLPVGLAAGIIAVLSDRAIIRFINRQIVLRSRSEGKSNDLALSVVRAGSKKIKPVNIPLAGQPRKGRELGIHRVRQALQPSFEERFTGLGLVALAAALEEIIYRGFLVGVCFLIPEPRLVVLALFSTVAAFALSHIWFGWAHVLAKLPLGVVTMISVLALGTVIPAVVAHVLFNIKIWKEMRSATPGGNEHRQSENIINPWMPYN